MTRQYVTSSKTRKAPKPSRPTPKYGVSLRELGGLVVVAALLTVGLVIFVVVAAITGAK